MDSEPIRGKARNLVLLALVGVLAMGLWFSASAVVPQLSAEWSLGGAAKSWMTMSVQLGFVVGALLSAIFNLPDRIPARTLIAISASVAALANLVIPLAAEGPMLTLSMRFLTGAALAGVYPPGMKLMATWCLRDRGFGIGLLVGALTLGSAMPHLLNGILGAKGMPDWHLVLIFSSAMAFAASLFTALFVRPGPYLTGSAPFNWRFAAAAFSHRPTRLANFGYLGHMWELYSMWAWVLIFLIASYQASGWSVRMARMAGFGAIAIGALGCVLAGILADRLGRTTITIASLAISGSCAVTAGLLFHRPGMLTALCLLWGFAVVADSAQFSAAVSELTDPLYVGSALTLQTSLGFLLTLLTIWIVPPLVELLGWSRVFIVLAIGPILGIISMARLRAQPEATMMASGKK